MVIHTGEIYYMAEVQDVGLGLLRRQWASFQLCCQRSYSGSARMPLGAQERPEQPFVSVEVISDLA